jgi:thioredoxin reductase (NADPH)
MTDTDTVVIGAGPAGLYQAFQLGLLGLRVALVDALPHAGGQVVELYGDKPIYDIPALPLCTGHELVARLLEQLQPLQPGLHFGHAVQTLQPTADGRWQVGTAQHTFTAGAVVIAAGVGAFEPRRLKLAGIEAFEGAQVFHRRQPAARFAGQRLVIVGGDETALEQAIACAEAHGPSHPVTLVHRRRVFQAPDELVQRFDALCDAGAVRFVAGQPNGLDLAEDGRLQGLQLLGPDGETQTLPLDALQVLLGLSPKLGPVTEWGLALERKQLVVDPATGATSQPGVYAIGDVVHYPGKKRLIACAFHEATMAAHAVLAQLHPDQAGPLLYTSSSTLLQQRLGVVAAPQRD